MIQFDKREGKKNKSLEELLEKEKKRKGEFERNFEATVRDVPQSTTLLFAVFVNIKKLSIGDSSFNLKRMVPWGTSLVYQLPIWVSSSLIFGAMVNFVKPKMAKITTDA